MKFLLALLVLFCAPMAALGHGRSVSYSRIDLTDGGATVLLRVTRLDRDALEHALLGRSLSNSLPEQLRLRTAGGPCALQPGSFAELDAPMGFSRFEWQLRCGGPPTAVQANLLFDVVPAHLHFAHVALPGLPAVELLFTDDRRVMPLAGGGAAPAPASGFQTFARYFLIGVRHIVTGWDHLTFLFALCVLARTFTAVAAAATGFTAGHSLTLALAALGILRPDPAAVEALVALSIVLLAVENIWLLSGRRDWLLPASTIVALLLLALGARFGPRPGHLSALSLLGFAVMVGCHCVQLARSRTPFSPLLRAAMAGLFGMVHGFAFAAVLQEAALSARAVVVRLLGFNLGVEAGQLLILFCAIAGFSLAVGRRWSQERRRTFAQVGSAAAAGVGMYWLVVRGF